ncbi:MAG TPA: hypothetical protein DDW27_13210 [Bacteroidales bacterium]|nr:hypothetical protein [Bacteroidales bacterium]
MWKKIVYLTIILLISSCTDEINCPGFPEKYLVWMPYIRGEEFLLTNGIDTFKFIVESVDITKAYTAKCLKNWECSCDCYAIFTITSTNDFFPTIDISSDTYSYGADFRIAFQTDSGVDILQFRDNNGESFLTYWPYQHNEFLNSYDNGYKIFNDVIKIESDTLLLPEILLSETQIYQIYIAKKVGIIQFTDRFNHKTWSLIE